MREFSGQRDKLKYFHSLTGEGKMDAFREMVEESDTISFLGGAGVATGSGIPDFRSKNGLYWKTENEHIRHADHRRDITGSGIRCPDGTSFPWKISRDHQQRADKDGRESGSSVP